jgi:hypothetical protein
VFVKLANNVAGFEKGGHREERGRIRVFDRNPGCPAGKVYSHAKPCWADLLLQVGLSALRRQSVAYLYMRFQVREHFFCISMIYMV